MTRKTINLALQGGGAHGAFTWGVLDALLEDDRLEFEGISGTSAGAMNAVVMADGLLKGGRAGARIALAGFWRAVANSQPLDMSTTSIDGESVALLPSAKLMLQWTRYLSPYQLNPLNLNPLREVVSALIDFPRLRTECPIKLFIAATQANSGRLRLFKTWELTEDMLLASACLPMLQQAIMIDGEPYWDGGYSANPAVFPLFYECRSHDMLLVLLSPQQYDETPRSVDAIRERTLELAFSANFLREMRMFSNVTRYAARSQQERESSALHRLFGKSRDAEPVTLEERLLATRFHLIEASDLMSQLGPGTKMAADPSLLTRLHDQGYQQAKSWLAEHFDAIGQRSTVDLASMWG